MKYRITNTSAYWGELEKKYRKVIEEIFGEIETKQVYRGLNDTDYRTVCYIDVKSLEQIQELINKNGIEVIIFKSKDEYVFIQEVNKYVYVNKEDSPEEWVLEIYDDWRE